MLQLGGTVLNRAQREVPLSRDVAAARLTAWNRLGDDLESLAAEHQLRVIDPQLEGIPRLEPMTVVAVIAVIACIGGRVVLETVDLSGYISPENRVMLLKLLDRGALAAGGFLLGGPAGAAGASLFPMGGSQ